MDRISVPDGDIITHPLSTNDIQIPKAPVILISASTLPRRVLSSSEKMYYLSPLFMSSNFHKTGTISTTTTLEMHPKEYCVFLASMAKHGSTSESQLPNLVAMIQLDKVVVSI
jgi:hypothetical protein